MPLPQFQKKTGVYTVLPSVLTKQSGKLWPAPTMSQKIDSPYSKYVTKGKYLLAEDSEQMLTESGEFLVYE